MLHKMIELQNRIGAITRRLSLILHAGVRHVDTSNRTLHITFTGVCIASSTKLQERSGCCGIRTSDVTQAWWLSSRAWDLKPQQWRLIGTRSVDKSMDAPFLCGCYVLPWFLSQWVCLHTCINIFLYSIYIFIIIPLYMHLLIWFQIYVFLYIATTHKLRIYFTLLAY